MNQDPYKIRKEILEEINNGRSYDDLINCKSDDKTYTGFIYETICDILMASKYLIDYDKFYNNHINDQCMTELSKFNDKNMFNQSIRQHGNKSDRTYGLDGFIIPTSIKYHDSYGETDLVKLDNTMKKKGNKYKLSLIVKDKNLYINHKFMHDKDEDKLALDKVIEDDLLLDEKDVIIAYKRFQDKLRKLKYTDVNNIIEWMNSEYLNNPRKNLILKLHQYLAFKIIMNNISDGEKRHLLSHKPRSGKTITLLFICKELLKFKKKILLMTSVMPEQLLSSFISELNKYNEFKRINYKTQNEFMNIDEDFNGIIFCSVQYLKNDNDKLFTKKKMLKLKELNCDVCIFDECHIHSTNHNTYMKIINITKNENMIQIFASGTSNKTLEFYNVTDNCNAKWDTEDENKMKNIQKLDNIEFMNNRHSSYGINKDLFKKLLNIKDRLDCNYDNCPLQVLLQPQLSLDIINQLNDHNKKYDDDKGYNCASMFALKQIKKVKSKDCKYEEKFQLDENPLLRRYLIKYLESIISDNPNDPNYNNTLMNIIEKTQNYYNSRVSDENDPKLFLMFLPFGQNLGTIDKIQKTLKKFLEDNKLWTNYTIEYSNSNDDSLESHKAFLEKIDYCMKKTKKDGKLGCILLLGNQGRVGITYDNCDVTISFDNGDNLDEIKQTYFRSMTEGQNKKIGINVDMNIHRVILYHNSIIRNYKKITNTNKRNSEILQYLYNENLYIFNPQDYKMGDCKESLINYFDKIESKLKSEVEININLLIDNISCKDDINLTIEDYKNKIINNTLEGTQKECPKGEKKKVKIDSIKGIVDNEDIIDQNSLEDIDDNDTDIDTDVLLINKTKILYGRITKLVCVLLRSERLNTINDNKTGYELALLLKNPEDKIYKNKLNSILNIISNKLKKNNDLKNIYYIYLEEMNTKDNKQIIDELFNIYSYAEPNEIRKIISELFIPSKEERENNAEIPTPEICVDEMLNKIPTDIWKGVVKIFEPCCGKGNFVLGIFEKLYEGLNFIEDKFTRCKIIIEDCIYFADISEENVLLTKELLLIHAVSKLNNDASIQENPWDLYLKVWDFKTNDCIIDTLKLNIKKVWDIEYFDIIIGNPPYQEKNKNGKSKHGKSNLWTKFIDYSFKNLKPGGYLLFITPSSWLGGTVTCFKNMISKQIIYLDINECKKYFPGVGSTFSYYLIENTPIYKNTEVVCNYKKILYKSEIMLCENMKLLPQLLSKDSINLINKIFNWDNEKIFIRKDLIKNDKIDLKKVKNETHKYKVLNFIKKDGTKDIRYCNFKLPTEEYKKVLLFRSGYLNPTYENGDAGVGNNIHYAKVDTEEEGINLRNLYNSELYKFMFAICKSSQYNNGNVMNWLYRKNPQYVNIYEYFKLNSDEIKLIEG